MSSKSLFVNWLPVLWIRTSFNAFPYPAFLHLYADLDQTEKHLPKSPFTCQFFLCRHFALLSIQSLIYLRTTRIKVGSNLPHWDRPPGVRLSRERPSWRRRRPPCVRAPPGPACAGSGSSARRRPAPCPPSCTSCAARTWTCPPRPPPPRAGSPGFGDGLGHSNNLSVFNTSVPYADCRAIFLLLKSEKYAKILH